MARTNIKKVKVQEDLYEISDIPVNKEEHVEQIKSVITTKPKHTVNKFSEIELRELYTKLLTGISPLAVITLVKNILHVNITNEEQAEILSEYKNSIEKWLGVKQIIPLNTECLFRALFSGKSPADAISVYIHHHNIDKEHADKLMTAYSQGGLYGAIAYISEHIN